MQLRLANPNISLDGMRLPILEALIAAMWIWERRGLQVLTITGAVSSSHDIDSPLCLGGSIDIRARTLPDVLSMFDDLRAELGDKYQVELELDHIHIVYDP